MTMVLTTINEDVSPSKDGDFFQCHILGGGFKYFLFSPLFRGRLPFGLIFFKGGWFNHQLDISFQRGLRLEVEVFGGRKS